MQQQQQEAGVTDEDGDDEKGVKEFDSYLEI